MSEDNKLIVERKKKLGELSKKSKPYPNDFHRDTYAEELTSKYGQRTKEDLENERRHFLSCW